MPQPGQTNGRPESSVKLASNVISDSRRRQNAWALVSAAALFMVCNQNARSIESADRKPMDNASAWQSYNEGYKSERYSALEEITAQNVGSLKEVCHLKLAEAGPFETGLVVVDGTMYLTRSLDTYALDPITCKVRWKYTYTLDQAEVPVLPHVPIVAWP